MQPISLYNYPQYRPVTGQGTTASASLGSALPSSVFGSGQSLGQPAIAGSISTQQNNPMLGMMSMMLQMMMQFTQLMMSNMGQTQQPPAQQPGMGGANPYAGTIGDPAMGAADGMGGAHGAGGAHGGAGAAGGAHGGGAADGAHGGHGAHGAGAADGGHGAGAAGGGAAAGGAGAGAAAGDGMAAGQPGNIDATAAAAAQTTTAAEAGQGSLVGDILGARGFTAVSNDDSLNAGVAPAVADQATTGEGIQTGALATPDVNREVNFHEQDFATRSQEGLSDTDRAILHLWGRQMISKGFQDGSVYNNVMDDAQLPPEEQAYKPAEHALVAQLAAKETAEYGATNGKELDNLALNLINRMSANGQQIDVQKYLATEPQYNNGERINQIDDKSDLEAQTGLNDFSQAILRGVGHDPLLNGGKIDGSVLAYTIGNKNALDNQGVSTAGAKGDAESSVDGEFQSLLESDFASDGVRNGDSLMTGLGQVLDNIYLGAPQASAESVKTQSVQTGQMNGRSLQQIGQDMKNGSVKALADASKMIKDHPMVTAAAVGGIAAASAVCPFLGGMAAGGAGIAAASKMFNKE